MKKKMTWNIPAGLRDYLPGEAAEKRVLMNTVMEKLALWGYEEIATPLLEYHQVLSKGESGQGPDHLYKLIDRDGSILALRSEMTTPIARIVSSKIKGQAPWRLMYGAEAFRYEDIQAGRQREFTQAGVELIGQKGPEADGEILALAIDTLKEMGLTQFTVSLGHTGILRGLLEGLSWEDEALSQVRTLILEKDFVGLQDVFCRLGLDRAMTQRLLELLTRPIKPAELVGLGEGLSDTLQFALKDLQRIVEQVERYGLSAYLQLDLSTLRSQSYYTGMVFEIYTPGIGYPIGGGGRYDQLLKHFGSSHPATGFALGIERLMLSLQQRPEKRPCYYVAGQDPSKVLAKGLNYRKQGFVTTIELRPVQQDDAGKQAREKDAQFIWVAE